MLKKQLAYYHRKIRIIKARYFLIAAAGFLILGVYGLRQNNLQMIELRQAVVTADEQDGDIDTALNELRQFVYGHMNTNLSSGDFAIKPPIQLKGRYERLIKDQEKNIEAQNREVARQAEVTCARQHPGAGFNSPRVACIQQYISRNARTINDVPSDLYKFDFVSPRWSPDLAGLSLLLSGLFFLIFLTRFLVERWFIAQLK